MPGRSKACRAFQHGSHSSVTVLRVFQIISILFAVRSIWPCVGISIMSMCMLRYIYHTLKGIMYMLLLDVCTHDWREHQTVIGRFAWSSQLNRSHSQKIVYTLCALEREIFICKKCDQKSLTRLWGWCWFTPFNKQRTRDAVPTSL